jgi:hypothetical protein
LTQTQKETLCWGSVRDVGEHLVATAFRPQNLVDAQCGHDGNGGDWAKDRMPMRHLMVLDRNSGRLVWSRRAESGVNNLCCSGLRLQFANIPATKAPQSKVPFWKIRYNKTAAVVPLKHHRGDLSDRLPGVRIPKLKSVGLRSANTLGAAFGWGDVAAAAPFQYLYATDAADVDETC